MDHSNANVQTVTQLELIISVLIKTNVLMEPDCVKQMLNASTTAVVIVVNVSLDGWVSPLMASLFVLTLTSVPMQMIITVMTKHHASIIWVAIHVNVTLVILAVASLVIAKISMN